MRARWIEARVALSLLTRLPTGPLPEDLIPTGRTAWAFPLVGLLVGGVSGLVFLVASVVLPPLVAAMLSIATGVFLTGGLHEDGLADVADGFVGGQSKDAKLEIMRDSRIGTYGVLALILALGVIGTAMASQPATTATFCLYLAIGAASRSAMLLPMALLPPARSDGLGQGAALSRGGSFWCGIALGLLAALLVFPLLLVGVLAAGVTMLWMSKRMIGGQTGDVLGATQKLAECAAWLLAAGYVSAS